MDGVILTTLKKIHNPKGDIYHAMKKSDYGFNGFGEAYFSSINQNDIKGWKKHSVMTLNIIVPIGEIKFVVFNEDTKKFFSETISSNNYQRLTIKPGLWVAFQGIQKENLLLNIASTEHDPTEAKNLILDDIKYAW
tara:strand:- start:195 stop:602 length:408 start_codon:yes stop_codon:yes gene_type:complete